MKVLWVDTGIVTIPLFKVDVPLSSKCIRFSTKFSRPKPNYEVKIQEIFRPSCLLMHEDLGHCKVFQILVIDDHVDRECRAFKIMSPSFEGFKKLPVALCHAHHN